MKRLSMDQAPKEKVKYSISGTRSSWKSRPNRSSHLKLMQSLVGVVLLSMAGVATSNWIIDRKLKIIQTLFPYQGKIRPKSCCLRLHSPIQLITSEIICQEKIQNNSLTTWYTRGFLISFLEPSPGPNSRPETIFFKELSKLSSAVFGCYFHLERDLLWQRS